MAGLPPERGPKERAASTEAAEGADRGTWIYAVSKRSEEAKQRASARRTHPLSESPRLGDENQNLVAKVGDLGLGGDAVDGASGGPDLGRVGGAVDGAGVGCSDVCHCVRGVMVEGVEIEGLVVSMLIEDGSDGIVGSFRWRTPLQRC